jgi:hypothetical protein
MGRAINGYRRYQPSCKSRDKLHQRSEQMRPERNPGAGQPRIRHSMAGRAWEGQRRTVTGPVVTETCRLGARLPLLVATMAPRTPTKGKAKDEELLRPGWSDVYPLVEPVQRCASCSPPPSFFWLTAGPGQFGGRAHPPSSPPIQISLL